MSEARKIIVVMFLLFAGTNAFGQDFLYGKVTDESGVGLSNVEVFWGTSKESDKDKQLTKADGSFKIKILKDSTKRLVVTTIGKKTVFKSITEAEYNEFIQIVLEEKGVTSVTASRWEQSVYDIPASVVVITREEIAQNGYMTFEEILENVPGLFVMDHRSENGITLGVRGFWSDANRNVMIQVNGVNMISERWTDFGFDKMNVSVESIDKIEIVRGPMNVMYGSGAFFGVINVITNDNQGRNNGTIATGIGLQSINNDNFSAGFGNSAGGNAFGIQKNIFRYSGGKDGLNFSFNAMTFAREGFHENWDDMIEDDAYAADAASTSIPPNSNTISNYQGTAINRDRYSKNHRALNFSANYNGFFADVNYAASNFGASFTGQPGPGDRNDYESFTGNYQLGYRGSTPGNRFSYEAKAAYMKSNTVAEMKYFSDSAYSYGEDRNSSVRFELNTRVNLLKSIKSSDPQIDLLTGLYYNRNFEHNSYYNLPEYGLNTWFVGLAPESSVNTKAAYVQAEAKLGEWIVIAGLRAEHESAYELLSWEGQGTPQNLPLRDTVDADKNPTLIPRVALIYKRESNKGRSNHYIKLMFGQAIREPNAAKNAGDVMRANYFFRNENFKEIDYLNREKLTTYEVGYTYVNRELKVEFNTNFFFNDLDNLIVTESYVTPTNVFIGFSRNLGEMRTYGVELIAKKTFEIDLKRKKALKLITSISGTYQGTENFNRQFENDPVKVSFSPQTLGTFTCTGIFEDKKNHKYSVGISGNYVGEMKAHYVFTQEIIDVNDNVVALTPGSYIGNPTGDYFRLGLNLRAENFNWFGGDARGFYFNLRISNLMNEQYFYPTYTTVGWAEKGILGRGRQFLLSIGYNF